MNYLKNFFYSPGGNDPVATSTSINDEDQKGDFEEAPENRLEVKEDKPIIEKIKEALQDWSNKDEADQEFDDTRV